MTKFFLVVFGILYCLAIVGYIVPTWPHQQAPKIMLLAENVGLLIMLFHGTLPGSRLVNGIVAGYVIMRAGWIILEYKEVSVYLIILGNAIILGTYMIHFTRKPVKQHLDILKLLTVIIFVVEPSIIILNLLPGERISLLSLASHVIFALTFLDFVFTTHKAGALLDS